MIFTIPNDGVYRIRAASASGQALYMTLTKNAKRVLLQPLNTQNDLQKWNFHEEAGKVNTYKISSFDHSYTLSYAESKAGSNFMGAKPEEQMRWTVEVQPLLGSRLHARREDQERYKFQADASNNVVCVMPSDRASLHQYWAFEQVTDSSQSEPSTQPPIQPQLLTQSPSQSFENKFFPLTVEQAAQQPKGKEYDIIIVGSGIGGGVLAHDLYETNRKLGPDAAKRILLLEKGGLVFHSHVLNTARQAGLENERGPQNDTFLQFKEDYQYTTDSEQPKDPSGGWKSGPMFNLGGRSAAWGLFVPRLHDKVLENHFPKVHKDLLNEYYEKAERLMGLSLPTTKRIHRHIMDQLTIAWRKTARDSQVQWQWSRVASKYQDDGSVGLAEGAYNTIDKILAIAMSKPKSRSSTGEPQGGARERRQEHEHFRTVLHADVRSLSFRETGAVSAVNVRTFQGNTIPIPVKPGGKVVLCAGSVNSPAILLRSEKAKNRDAWEIALLRHGGLHLTDHDIFVYSHPFHYSDAKHRDEFGAMKLQTHVNLGSEGLFPGLVYCNMSIDAASFLPTIGSPDMVLPQMIVVFMLQRSLVGSNSISLGSSNEPMVEMIRGEGPGQRQVKIMRELTASAMNCLKETAGLRFVGFERDFMESDIKLEILDLGEVAHELGTLPMDTDRSRANCLDKNLRIVPKLCDGVYVCDLSCFPYSPESNPSLTLAALAIRLSRHLHPRHSANIASIPADEVRIVNHSGVKIRVWLSNHQPSDSGQLRPAEPAVEIEPGKEKNWTRNPGTVQAVFVYWPDLNAENGTFQDEPVFIKAYPGKLVTIQS